MKPVVVNKYKEVYDVYIGRGSFWGNPFPITQEDDRDMVIAKYAKHLQVLYDQDKITFSKELLKLTGKRLGCFCKPQACHGDIIVTAWEQMYGVVESFRDEYSWLSNFQYFDKPLIAGGNTYLTNEHFYQAMKTKDKVIRKAIANHPSKGLKKFVSSVQLREDWDDIKLDVMRYGLQYKFSDHNPNLRKKLIETNIMHLQEGNWWNDKFWGVCLKDGEGENNLGILIMEVREEICNAS